MDTLIKILVVEDEMIIAAKISIQLTNLGYIYIPALKNQVRAANDMMKVIKNSIILKNNATTDTGHKYHQGLPVEIL